jgi:S-adenosylhomocysteine hydrolase
MYVAEMKLKSLGITIDKFTPEQGEYMGGWEHGT